MIYCRKFGYTPAINSIESAADHSSPVEHDNIQAAFIEVEQEDMDKEKEVEKKLKKNLIWVCVKNQCKEIVLHSFAHATLSSL